jgi:hypothetical protein
MMGTTSRNERSTIWLGAFHGKDNFVVWWSGGGLSCVDTGIRNGYREKITSFSGFIHSLLVGKMAGLKRVVITGGTGGLGKAIVHEFAGKGWDVVALGRTDLDLADNVSVPRFFEINPCDLLVCCAGMIRDVPLLRMAEEQWDDVLSVNFNASALCAAAAVPGMLAKGCGHVVFVSSYAALHRNGKGRPAWAGSGTRTSSWQSWLAIQCGVTGFPGNADDRVCFREKKRGGSWDSLPRSFQYSRGSGRFYQVFGRRVALYLGTGVFIGQSSLKIPGRTS